MSQLVLKLWVLLTPLEVCVPLVTVLEGDCDIESVPPKCPTMLARGWEGIHSLPRIVAVETLPPLSTAPAGAPPRHALRFEPLPALRSLRTGASGSTRGTNTSGPVKLSSGFRSHAFHITLTIALSAASSTWDAGVQLLWSDDSREYTRVGLRSADWLNGSELVYINEEQRAAASCVEPHSVGATPEVCRAACDDNERCLGWSAVAQRNATEAERLGQNFMCHVLCDVVPLQAVSGRDCNWGSLHDTTLSVAGMKGREFASLYMQRSRASLAVRDAGPPGYGAFDYAGLVRILPAEAKAVRVDVYADKSIVEAFAVGGRAALTGRVYPSLPNATNVGVYASGATVNADAWEMGNAFE